MEEKIKSRKEGFELMLKESLKKLSEKPNVISIFKEYFLIESTYTSIIKESQLDNQITKYLLYSYLNDYYYISNNEKIILSRKNYEKYIKAIFYSFVLSPSFVPLIDKLFGDEGESTFDTNKNSIMKGIHQSFYDLVIKEIRNTLGLDVIPNFILYYDKKIVNAKINDIIIYKYNFNFEEKDRRSIEYKYMENLFKLFLKDFKPLFDINIFSEDFKIKLFKLMFLSNYKYIKMNDLYNKKFLDKFERYILIFQLKPKHQELFNEYLDLFQKNEEDIEKEKNKVINEINEDLFQEKSSNGNVIVIQDDNNQGLKSLNKRYIKIIFSFSLIFNNIIAVIIKNKDEPNEEITYKLNNKIRCSSIERQFLLNILNVFKEKKSFIFNYLLETYIFEEATKKYNRHLYHKIKENEKVTLPYNSIINGMTAGFSDNNNNNDANNQPNTSQQDDINNKMKNLNFENKKFLNSFIDFYTKYQFIFDQKEIKIGLIGSLFNKKIPLYIDTPMGKMVNYAIHNLKLIPIVCRKISAFQVTIIIDGCISPEILFETDEKFLSHKERLCNFFTNSVYLNGDFYCYDWQSLNYINKTDFKEVAYFYGILLAYIIISKLFFQFQTINLIGYSTGCKVIKSCLKQLHELKNVLNINDIINNIILIGGASHYNMDKYPYLFDNVSGKVVNIFSNKDDDLFKYKKTAVGLSELKLKNDSKDKYKYDIVNIDLSKKFVKQDEYLMELPKILIKDFNIN